MSLERICIGGGDVIEGLLSPEIPVSFGDRRVFQVDTKGPQLDGQG